MMRFITVLAGAFLAAAQGLAQAPPPVAAEVESQKAEPGLTYGVVPDLALPKTIVFSVGPEEVVADAEEWARHGVNGFFLDFIARDWSSDIWAGDQKPWTIGESDELFQKTKQANAVCRQIGSETFLKVAFDHPFEWFNDLAWETIEHNFRQFAIFARETRCAGIALDIEYINEQYSYDWPGYDYKGYSREDLVKKVSERATRMIGVLYEEFPEMVFLTFPESGLSLGGHIHAAWFEEAARRNAPGGIHYCTEYTYRHPNIRYMFGHAWVCNDLFQRILSLRARQYWKEKCSIAAGFWPFGFDYQNVYDPGMPLDEFRQGYGASLMISPRYNWIYSHNCRAQLIGRDLDKYTGSANLQEFLDVIAKREVVTTPKYVDLAKELREMKSRDYSGDLGVVPYVSFAGPSDVPYVRLAPAVSVGQYDPEGNWSFALQYFQGASGTLHDYYQTQTDWMVIGPFPNEPDFKGHEAVYPPEEEIDLNAEYDGVGGKIRWREFREEGGRATVDLTKAFTPTENVTAYAVCYVTSPNERQAQLRVGTNDAGKVWLGSKLVYEYGFEGTAWLDRDLVPVTIPAGTMPILVKVSNKGRYWGFVLRITDDAGQPMNDLQFSLAPSK